MFPVLVGKWVEYLNEKLFLLQSCEKWTLWDKIGSCRAWLVTSLIPGSLEVNGIPNKINVEALAD